MSIGDSVTVLHVSDMQFGAKHRFGLEGAGAGDRRFSTLAARLLDDVRSVEADSGVRPDLIVASGDLAEHALTAEFAEVEAFLTEVASGLGFGAERVVMVPGNHDINWKKCQAYFLNCEDEAEPAVPYWPKYEPYAAMFASFYKETEARFPPDLPWTLFRIPGLKTVVAGLNSTLAESHRDEDHYGYCGEEQLRWFARELAQYERDGWLRIGVLHHNPLIEDRDDEAFLADNQMFGEVLDPYLNLILHGHTHKGRVDSFGADATPILAAGSAGVLAEARPDDVPNQYQLVRIHATAIEVHGRRYNPDRYRWEGDTAIGIGRNEAVRLIERPLSKVHAAFPDDELEHSAHLGSDLGELNVRVRLAEDDLLARVQAVCQVRHPEAQVERIDAGPGRPLSFLRVTERRSSQALLYPVGVIDGPVSRQAVALFLEHVDKRYRAGDPTVRSILVYEGQRAAEELRLWAAQRGVDLQELVKFQGMYNLEPYADRQAGRLARTEELYPRRLFVPQRFRLVADPRGEPEIDLLSRLREWICDPDGRFVVVLGDFGHGKTFLLRELTRIIHTEKTPPVIPILIQLRHLEKAHSLEELLAAQLTAGGEELIDHRLLRHLIHEGRVLLLFDGFDELALRVTYQEAAEHLSNLVRAGAGRAKVVVTSRTQHFLSDREVETALAKITDLPGRRLVKLHEFDDGQILTFLTKLLDGDAKGAEHRLELIRHIRDLLGLSRNPRMLSFIVRLDHERLEKIRDREGEISAARLYEELLTQWLIFEYERSRPPGSAPTLSPKDRWDAVTSLALLLWESEDETLDLATLNQVSSELESLAELQLTEDQAAHMLGSGTLLIRTEDERFKFVHRSVMEWLVANRIAETLPRNLLAPTAALFRPMSDLMVDFLCGRADHESLVTWTRDLLLRGRVNDGAVWNALLVLRRLNLQPLAVAGEFRIQLGGCNLSGIDLSNMDLRGADLNECVLRGAKLDGVNLAQADLRGADLSEASMAEADFSHADLRGARLAYCAGARTRLIGSDLRGADLSAVRLPEADLTDAKTDDANFWRANLVGAALGDAGLDSPHTFGAVLPGHPLPHFDIRPPRHMAVNAIARSPDGRILATAISSATYLWDLTNGRILRTLERRRGRVTAADWSSDGHVLVTAGDDGVICLWDAATGDVLHRLEGRTRSILAVRLSPDGHDLAFAQDDGAVYSWDLVSGHCRLVLGELSSSMPTMACSLNDRSVATAANDGTIHFRDLTTGQITRVLDGEFRWAPGVSVALSPDGHSLATVELASDDHGIRLWDPATGRCRRVLERFGSMRAIAWSLDGRSLASIGHDDACYLLDPDAREVVHRLEARLHSVHAVGLSLDGHTLAYAYEEGGVRLWDSLTGHCQGVLEGHGDLVRALAWSPDKRTLAIGDNGGMIRLWDPVSGECLRELDSHTDYVLSVAVNPEGHALAFVGSDGEVCVWDLLTGHCRKVLDGRADAMEKLAWSPDGHALAVVRRDGQIYLWYPVIGQSPRALGRSPSHVWALAWSPDGQMLAVACGDGVVRLWDPATGEILHALECHTDSVLAAGWSADGRTLTTVGDDGTVRFWDETSWTLIATVIPLRDGMAAVGADGLTYKVDGTVDGEFWWTVGLCPFAPGELDPYVPQLRRLPADTPLAELNQRQSGAGE